MQLVLMLLTVWHRVPHFCVSAVAPVASGGTKLKELHGVALNDFSFRALEILVLKISQHKVVVLWYLIKFYSTQYFSELWICSSNCEIIVETHSRKRITWLMFLVMF